METIQLLEIKGNYWFNRNKMKSNLLSLCLLSMAAILVPQSEASQLSLRATHGPVKLVEHTSIVHGKAKKDDPERD